MPAGKRRLAVWIGAAGAVAGTVAAVLALRCGDRPDAPVAGPHPGRASPVDSPTRPASDAAPVVAEPASAAGLVESGRLEAAAGHYVKALALYQRAHEREPGPATLLEVGRMQHLTGRCREARRTTQRVLAATPGAPIADEAQQLLDKIGRCD